MLSRHFFVNKLYTEFHERNLVYFLILGHGRSWSPLNVSFLLRKERLIVSEDVENTVDEVCGVQTTKYILRCEL